MKIVLIGFMGSGKTTIAVLLANKMNLKVVDIDQIILKKSKRKNINEIFETDGEKKFREMELQVAKNLEGVDSVVIATGGGVVMNRSIMRFLGKNAKVIYLKKSFDKIKEHISLKEIRPPLFQNVASSRRLFKLRVPLYEQYADMIINTDNKNLTKIVREIMEVLNGR